MPAGVEGFGRCLLHALQGMLAEGHAAACVLSSDGPTLPTERLVEAASLLLAPGCRAVLGPAEDGGYYLLGIAYGSSRPVHRHRLEHRERRRRDPRSRPQPRSAARRARTLVRRRRCRLARHPTRRAGAATRRRKLTPSSLASVCGDSSRPKVRHEPTGGRACRPGPACGPRSCSATSACSGRSRPRSRRCCARTCSWVLCSSGRSSISPPYASCCATTGRYGASGSCWRSPRSSGWRFCRRGRCFRLTFSATSGMVACRQPV